MTQRRGVTLLEVLVSIFVMGIGMIALLTLFPLGALSMAQAIRDGRVNDASAEAAALANTFGVRNDGTTSSYSVTGVFNAYLSAGWAASAPAADPVSSGYPVYVDPYYVAHGQTSLGSYGSAPYSSTSGSTPGIIRCSTSYVGSNGNSYTSGSVSLSALGPPTAPTSESPGPSNAGNWAARFFTLKDDINFQSNGTAVGYSTGSPTTTLERGGGYTWAYLLRRPKATSGAEVELYVVVYAGRSVQLVSGETACPVTSATTAGFASQGDNAVSMSIPSGTGPQLRRGAWLLDTSYEQTVAGPPAMGFIHGDFYRVVDVTNSTSPYIVELDRPLKRSNVSVMVVMDNVVEVVYKGTGWQP
jgi:prepilin-type N-terminal cleavage/methylation domain-containing protein